MAYTLIQLEAITEAIASGANTVRYGDKTVTYNSISDMLKVKELMEAELYPTQLPIRDKLGEFSKGL